MLESKRIDESRIHVQETIVSSNPSSLTHYLNRVWQMRRFAFTLAQRDVRVRHANTYFGLLWVFLQPVPSIIVFTFFFDRIISVDTSGIPYSIFALIGFTGWNFFTYLSVALGNVLYESADVIKKINFPRLLLPFSRVISGSIDFLVSLLLVAIAMLIFGVYPDKSLVFFPVFVILNILFGFTIGIWLCILTYKRKDLMFIVPIIVNFSIWLTPVFFPTTVLPEDLADAMYLNPMTLVCEGYRFTLVGGPTPQLEHFASVPVMVVLLVLGIDQFRRVDPYIPEHL